MYKGILKKALLFLEGLLFFRLGEKVKHGVVLVRLDAIGDFVVWLDSAKEYRDIYPNKKITLIANAAWAEMALSLPYWDDVWPVELSKLRWFSIYRYVLLRKVRKSNFEIAIQPTFSRVFAHGDSLIRATCATQRIGSQSNNCNISVKEKTISDGWYTNLLFAKPNLMAEMERNAEFLTFLTGRKYKAGLSKLPVMTKLPSWMGLDGGAYTVFFPGASWEGRRWPEESFVDLARRMKSLDDSLIVLCGSGSERLLCQRIAGLIPGSTMCMAGQTTLMELTELIRGAQLLISNETSAVHIAAAVGTPSICILGGGHFGRFVPYPEQGEGVRPIVAINRMDCFGCNWKCNKTVSEAGVTPCVSGISVDQVFFLVRQIKEGCLNPNANYF